VSRATWRSPAALATWIAIACELSRALAHYRSDARDDAAAASSPDDQQSDAISRFRYGADREPTWVALLGLLAVQALNALCTWAAETRAHKHAAWMRNVLHFERTVRVIRDGEPRRVSTREVVPGDVVRVRVGDVVPADVRIIPGDGLSPEYPGGGADFGDGGTRAVVRVDAGSGGGEGSIVVLAAGDAVAAGSTIVSGEATCVVTATGGNIHWMDDDVTRRHGASQGAMNEGNPLTRSDPSSSSSMDAGVSESSFVVNVSAAFVCVTLCAVLYAWDSYVDADGAPTDGGFFGAAALAAALFATAASVSHDSVVNGPTHMAIRTLARRGTAVTRRVFAVHALAEMDVVLVDERVVRTAGACGGGSSSEGGLELRAVHVTQTGVSPKDVLVAAALSSRWFEAPVDAVDAMILDAVDVAPLSDSYTLNEHALTGGDGGPRGWIATSTLARAADGGSTFRTCRGSVDAVVDMCDVGWDVHDEVTRRVEECAAAGVRCMAVAADYRGRSEEDGDSNEHRDESGDDSSSYVDSEEGGGAPRTPKRGGWILLGLLSYHDPPRGDSDYAVRVATELGVRTVSYFFISVRAIGLTLFFSLSQVLVSGEDARSTRELCRGVGLPTHVAGPECLDVPLEAATQRATTSFVTLEAERAGALAAMSGRDGANAARLFIARGWTAGYVGATALDIPAMRTAVVSIAGHTATDATRAVSAVSLSSPGLAALLHAIVVSRASYAATRGLLRHRVAVACQLLVFYGVACAFTRPGDFDGTWPKTFRVPVVAMCVLCVVDAFVTSALGGENILNNRASRKPERWRPPAEYTVAVTSGFTAALANLVFLGLVLRCNARGLSIARVFGFGPANYEKVVAASHLKACLGAILTAISARHDGGCHTRVPSPVLMAVIVVACGFVAALAASGAFALGEEDGDGALEFVQILFVVGYSLVAFAAQDGAKVACRRVLRRAGWLPTEATDPTGVGSVIGGATWRRSNELTRAESVRVEEFADAAAAKEFDGARTTKQAQAGRNQHTDGGIKEFGSPPRRNRARGGASSWDADAAERASRRERMLQESVRRDLSDRGPPRPGTFAGSIGPSESSSLGFTTNREGELHGTETESAPGGVPVPDYESEDGRMRPWAGLDEDDDDATVVSADDFGARDDDDDPAAAAAAAAGRRLAPAPAPARAIAAAAAAGTVRARAPGGYSWAPSQKSRAGGEPDAAKAAEAAAAAETAADAAVPRADRLRLHPEYVAATADDYAHLVRSHDWRGTLSSIKDEARRRGKGEVSVLDVGCGAGAFTAALAASGALLDPSFDVSTNHTAGQLDGVRSTTSVNTAVPIGEFRVDLLDPSPGALRAASASLVPPLVLGELRCASVQDFARARLGSGEPLERYDVVWAVHTLSHVPSGIGAGELGLAAALRSIGNLLRPGGFGFIAVPTNDSHYARFHALYRREFGPGTGFDAARIGDPSRVDGGAAANKLLANFSQYTAAEHVAAALSARGVAFNRVDRAHVTRVPASDASRLEAYLRGCAGDDAVSLDTMLANPRIGAYLASCRSADGTYYAFPQKVAHMTL
jgi:H+-transporting ATPase